MTLHPLNPLVAGDDFTHPCFTLTKLNSVTPRVLFAHRKFGLVAKFSNCIAINTGRAYKVPYRIDKPKNHDRSQLFMLAWVEHCSCLRWLDDEQKEHLRVFKITRHEVG